MADGPIMDALRQQEVQSRAQIDAVIENLSLCCEILENHELLDSLPKSLQAWWSSHKITREFNQKRQLARQARAKLTPEEFEALRELFSPHRGGGTSGV